MSTFVDCFEVEFASHNNPSDVFSITVYDDDHDLALFIKGKNLASLELAIKELNNHEPVQGDFSVVSPDGYVFTFKNNPSRTKILKSIIHTIVGLQDQNHKVISINDGWK